MGIPSPGWMTRLMFGLWRQSEVKISLQYVIDQIQTAAIADHTEIIHVDHCG